MQTVGSKTETRFRIVQGLVVRKVGTQVFVLGSSSAMHILENESAVLLWSRLEKAGPRGATVGEMGRCLEEEFAIDATAALADAGDFIKLIKQLSVVEEVAAPDK